MTEMVRIPAPHFGRAEARVVPADSQVRLELRLPAPLVRQLVLLSIDTGVPVTRLVADRLATTLSESETQE